VTPDIEIYDTTLRDGTQGHGISFSVADKLRIAERLDAFGVHYVEGGWPGSNPKDIEFFAEAKHRTFRNARLAAFGSTRRKGIAAGDDDQVCRLFERPLPAVFLRGVVAQLVAVVAQEFHELARRARALAAGLRVMDQRYAHGNCWKWGKCASLSLTTTASIAPA